MSVERPAGSSELQPPSRPGDGDAAGGAAGVEGVQGADRADGADPDASGATQADGARRGPISTRDDRFVLLVLGGAAALLIAALLVAALVRVLAGGDEAATRPPPSGPIGDIVPYVAASPVLLAPDEQTAQLTELLAERRHDVAAPSPVTMLCAAVVLDTTLQVAGRWERNGREVAATSPSPVGPPGFGDCVDDGGAPLDEGVYQFVVVDGAGQEAAAGSIVVGAAIVSQHLRNDTGQPLCTIRLAPTRAGYFDAYDLSAEPLPPGATLTLALAAVEHELQASTCGPAAETVVDVELTPDPATPRALTAS